MKANISLNYYLSLVTLDAIGALTKVYEYQAHQEILGVRNDVLYISYVGNIHKLVLNYISLSSFNFTFFVPMETDNGYETGRIIGPTISLYN